MIAIKQKARHCDNSPGSASIGGADMKKGTPKGAARRFAEDAANFDGDHCLIWPYAKCSRGYGRIRINGRTERVHRYVLRLATGEAPPGLVAAHEPETCHNPSCVNPQHLRWATQAENLADREADGTFDYENRATTKLRSDQVLAILNDSRTQAQIADQYNVSPSVISNIKNGVTWSRVTGINL